MVSHKFNVIIESLFVMLVIQHVYPTVIQKKPLQTKNGILNGFTKSVMFDGHSKYVTKFLGIPYAKPPVNERRFSRPEPYGVLDKEYDATFHRPHCVQMAKISYEYIKHFAQSEDCLYLNIYIPGNYSVDVTSKLPVMIYIHGGSFRTGGADVYDADILSSFNDVIVVTINYRLFIFGFLSSGDSFSGNYGLWDMKLAMQWVHDNINDFGGDPAQVTLFGNSAGGAAVLYQAINPQNRGLFQRMIAQSGSCFAFWAFQSNPAENFNQYVSEVGCNENEYSDVMKCLRSKNISDLIPQNGFSYLFNFVPSVDNDFLPESPVTLSKRMSDNGKRAMEFFFELDLIIGVLNYDGAYNWLHLSGENEAYSLKTYLNWKIDSLLMKLVNNTNDVLVKTVKHQYTDWENPFDPSVVRESLLNLESDVTFFVPSIHAAKAHTDAPWIGSLQKSNTYFYVFAQKPDFAPTPSWLKGATHAMDLHYVFGLSKGLEITYIEDYHVTAPVTVSERDVRLSRQMMRIWTNFAKTGNPNAMSSHSGNNIPTWPQYTRDTQMYLELSYNMTSDSIKHHFVSSRVKFWENIVPLLMNCSTHSGSNMLSLSLVIWYTEVLIVSVCLLSWIY